MTAEGWRALADDLAVPLTSGDLSDLLLSVTCPLCGAVSGQSCPLSYPRLGLAVAMLRAHPVAFCHLERMTAAAHSGTVTAEAILAQFANEVPVEFARDLGEIT